MILPEFAAPREAFAQNEDLYRWLPARHLHLMKPLPN